MTANNMCPDNTSKSAIKNWMTTLYQEVREKLWGDNTEPYTPSQMSHSKQWTKEIFSDNQKQPNWPATELTLLTIHRSLATLIQQVVKVATQWVHATFLSMGFYRIDPLLSSVLCTRCAGTASLTFGSQVPYQSWRKGWHLPKTLDLRLGAVTVEQTYKSSLEKGALDSTDTSDLSETSRILDTMLSHMFYLHLPKPMINHFPNFPFPCCPNQPFNLIIILESPPFFHLHCHFLGSILTWKITTAS